METDRQPKDPTIWIDAMLLQVCHPFQGSGINRTVVSLVRAIAAHGYRNIRMCTPCPRAGGYVEVDSRAIYKRLHIPVPGEPVGNGNAPAASPPPPGTPPSGGLLSSLKRHARAVLPHAARAALRRWHRALQESLSSSGSAHDSSHGQRGNSQPRLALGASDVVLSLGGGWASPLPWSSLEDLKRQQGFKSVQIVYDLIPVLEPQYMSNIGVHPPENYFDPVLRQADVILTISEFVKQTIHGYLEARGIGPRIVEVLRLGENIPENHVSTAPDLARYFDPTLPFALTVSTLEVRKNHVLLYQVWRRLVKKYGQDAPRLVIVGREAPLSEYLTSQLRADPLVGKHVIHLAHCDDQQLSWLYRNCLFTLYPSHHEGWGLPVAESMLYGKHCICSGATSMLEIAPHLVDFHDPIDGLGCLELVEKALHPEYRQAREERIRKEYRRTSWDDTARQMIAHIERHLGPVFLRMLEPRNQAA